MDRIDRIFRELSMLYNTYQRIRQAQFPEGYDAREAAARARGRAFEEYHGIQKEDPPSEQSEH